MKTLVVFFISFYQKRISPYKGFNCAHKAMHKGDSCSEYTKQQITNKGLLASLKNIKQRFKECGDSAFIIRQNSLKHQKGECDLGIGGCISCDLGASGSGAGKCLWGCSDIFSSSSKNRVRILMMLTIVILLLIICSYYFLGRQIDSVDIRLKEGIEETTDRSIGKLFNTQLPDYKINFILQSGTKTSNTLRNISAKNWISLTPKGSLYLSDIKEMTIVDRKITKSIKLESFTSPKKTGQGEKFEYSIRKKWDFF